MKLKGGSLMRRGLISLLLLFLAMLPAQLVSQQEPRAADVKELPQTSERWALLVGIEDYTDKNISPLTGPANDVDKMRDALVKYAAFPSDNITVLSTKSRDADMPTRNGILVALSKMKKRIPSNGLLLFMFSGHGISRGGRAFLLPSNAILTDDVRLLEDTSLSVDLLRERMADTQLKQVIVFLDACRNDPEKSKAASDDNPLSKPFTDALDFAGRNKEVEASAIVYATGIGERAYIDNSEELGYFTEAIIKGMGGAAVVDSLGQVTLGSLVKYIQSNVPKWVTRDLKKDQKPFYVIAGYQPEQLVVSAIATPQPTIPKGEGGGSVDARAGIIEVFSTEGGNIYIDGQDMGGVLPHQTGQFLQQPVGSHRVEIVASKKRETKEVIVESGRIAYISFGLESPIGGAGQSVGNLVIESTQQISGNVYIDNYKVGVLPENGKVEIANLAVGTHQYRIEGGTKSAMGVVIIREGESTWISVRPSPMRNLRIVQ
jgi:hypothetical protein